MGIVLVVDEMEMEAIMGVTIIVILLVPLMFQVFMMRQEQRKRHEEIRGRLDVIEKKLGL